MHFQKNLKQPNVEVIYKEQRGLDVPAIVLDSVDPDSMFDLRADTSLRTEIENYVNWFRAYPQKDGGIQ